MKSFASDNHAGTHESVLQAISAANQGMAKAYGSDSFTEKAKAYFYNEFGSDAFVSFVFTGTAANIIALKAVCPSYGAIICADSAHLQNDECGAPEAQIGAKLFLVKTPDGKLTPELIENQITLNSDVHKPKIKAISISQSTEYGTLYTCDEIKKLASFAHKNKLYLHLDGARISNASAALGVSFRAMTRDLGVDLVSFGGTKNGLMGAEAIIAFKSELKEPIEYLQKQSMQLGSKMRFVSAQFCAFFENELWRQNALQANRLTEKLYRGLASLSGVKITQTPQANALFAVFTTKQLEALQKEFYFYVWNERTLEVRLMTSFSTPEIWIDEFIKLAKSSS